MPVLIGFFAVPPVSLGAYQNMVLFLLICVTCYIGSQLLNTSLIGYLFWYGGAFLVEPLVTSVSSVDRYLEYLDGEPFVPLLLASYWCLVLKMQLGSVVHSPLLVPPPGMDSPWKSVSCLKIMKVCFAGCLRLICIAMVGLGAPLSRFLEGAPYKSLNE